MSSNMITIVLPNFNSEKYLNETLESIISQSYQNWNLKILMIIQILKLLKFWKNMRI